MHNRFSVVVLHPSTGALVTIFRRALHSLPFVVLLLTIAPVSNARAQADNIERISLSVGRALPIDLPGAVTQVSITNPDVADVVVLSERSVVVNAKAIGETDVLLAGAAIGRRHLRIQVITTVDRRQISLGVKFAEVRREALLELGVSGRVDTRNGASAAGTGLLSPGVNGAAPIASSGLGRFVSGVTSFGTDQLTAYLDAQQQAGNAKSLAEPTLLANNREEASFLAGGKLPIPFASNNNGQTMISIQYQDYGVSLKFVAEVLNDTLIKLKVTPSVSSLDFANAVLVSGFRIPALRARELVTTVDVRPGQSIVISGLFNEERENVRTGIPGLMNIPILGVLFSSNRWQRAESELLVVVTPNLVDPNNPRAIDRIRLAPDTTRPATDALQKRIPPP
jgi:pilus assembly protein CpaC